MGSRGHAELLPSFGSDHQGPPNRKTWRALIGWKMKKKMALSSSWRADSASIKAPGVASRGPQSPSGQTLGLGVKYSSCILS